MAVVKDADVPDVVTDEQRAVLAAVYDMWSRGNGQWPMFAEVDKHLDEQQVDAEDVLRSLCPRWVRVDGGQVPPALEGRVSLTVRGLVHLRPPPVILETFLDAVRYLAVREQRHQPQPPDRLTAVVTSAELADHVQTSASVPRPTEVAESLARAVGHLLEQEGYLWTGWSSVPEDASWRLDVSRRVRRFRGVVSVDDYLARMDDLQVGVTSYPPPQVPLAAVAEEPSVRPATTVTVDVGASVAPGVGAGGNGNDPRAVFVVHGRDLATKHAVFAFLRDLDLRPLDWEQLVAATGSAAPYVGDAVARAFPLVQAVVVILTPDDEARLLPTLRGPDEPPHETELTGQARPNVLFEAGMALALHPDRTVLAEIGRVRPFSDLAGRHMVRLTGAAASLHSLATRLRTAGCPVDTSGSGWLDEGRFRDLDAHQRSADAAPSADLVSATPLPRGTVLPPTPPPPAPPRLSLTVHPRGRSDYLIEIVNRGGSVLRDVSLVLPQDATNWHLLTDVLPAWPIQQLRPRDYRRFPAAVSMGGPAVVDAQLVATTDTGEMYEEQVTLSMFG